MQYKVIGEYLQVDNNYIMLYDTFYDKIVPDRLFIKLSHISSITFYKDKDKFICIIHAHENGCAWVPTKYSFYIKEYNQYIDTMIAFSDIIENVSANGIRLGSSIPPSYKTYNYATNTEMSEPYEQ